MLVAGNGLTMETGSTTFASDDYRVLTGEEVSKGEPVNGPSNGAVGVGSPSGGRSRLPVLLMFSGRLV